MKKVIQRAFKSRLTWFFVGVAVVPILSHIYSKGGNPTAKEAMGSVGYYEETKLMFTFIPDHSYSLKFPGNRKDFEKYAKRIKIDQHKVSDDLYKIRNEKEEWERVLSFHADDKRFNIHYSSGSW